MNAMHDMQGTSNVRWNLKGMKKWK